MSTDDLLDEATRLADRLHDVDPPEVRTLRALVERVRAAEAERDSAIAGTLAEDETMLRRDAERAEQVARGKLDAVRAYCERYPGLMAGRRILAILDGKAD